MILSIGMIVKNEEKYLRKCLQALLPILNQVKSELIIIDTGSTDNSVETAKEFTDKVYHFDWCNDFAAARNEAMKRAKGEWYMSVDADEILDDTKELISFFNSGEYKNYNSGTYIIRSVTDSDYGTATDINSLRLIKIEKDSYYINAVHEQFKKICSPTKFLSVVANHYGYVGGSNFEYLQNKMQRNLKIMFKELEKDPSNFIFYMYISQAYRTLGDLGKALEYCEKGLENSKGLKEDPIKFSFYSDKILINFELRDYLNAIKTADEYFSSKKNEIGTDIDIYFLKAESEFQLNKYNAAVKSFKDYLKFYKEFKKGMHNTFDTLQHSINYTGELYMRNATLRIADSYIETQDFKNACLYLHSIPVSDFEKDKNSIAYWLSLEFELMRKLKDFSRITALYQQIKDDYTLELLKKLVENELNSEDYRNLILKEFLSLKSKDNYQKLNKLRLDYYKGNLTAPAVQKFLTSIEDLTLQYADAVYFAFKLNLPIYDIASKIDCGDLNKYFLNNIYYHFNDLPSIIFNQYKNSWDKLDTNSQMFIFYLYFTEFNSGDLNEEYAVDLFNEYSKVTYSVLNALFKEDVLKEENASLLPQIFRVGYYSYMAENALEAGQNSQYLKYLEKVSKLNPQFNNVIKILIDRLENSLNNISSEFEAYAVQVKAAIKNMIKIKEIKEAAEILNEYEALCPNDKEIAALKSQIASVKN